jgi:hypothetical protein
LGPVNSSQVKHKVHFLQQGGQPGYVITTGKANYLHILALSQMQLQVLTNKPIGPR